MKIRGLLRLGDEMHFDNSRELESHRADCCGCAFEEAQRLVERFDLPALPTPHVDPPRSWRAQLDSWVVARLRELDGEGKDEQQAWEVTWDPDNPNFVSATEIVTNIADGRLTLSALSGMKGKIPVHFMQRGQRCNWHYGEFREYWGRTTPSKEEREAIADGIRAEWEQSSRPK